MTYLIWLVQLGLLAIQPQFCFVVDRRNFDGDKFTELCGGIYQQPRTWACVDVPGHHKGWR